LSLFFLQNKKRQVFETLEISRFSWLVPIIAQWYKDCIIWIPLIKGFSSRRGSAAGGGEVCRVWRFPTNLCHIFTEHPKGCSLHSTSSVSIRWHLPLKGKACLMFKQCCLYSNIVFKFNLITIWVYYTFTHIILIFII